jgi:hypothetical protein
VRISKSDFELAQVLIILLDFKKELQNFGELCDLNGFIDYLLDQEN